MAIIPIYSSKGEIDAFLEYPHIFNRNGDWIGFVTSRRQVYSVLGYYVGYLTNDPRIFRKASTSTLKPRISVPPEPPRISVPATLPLAPLMSEIPPGAIDVLLEEPALLHPVDSGELREDLG